MRTIHAGEKVRTLIVEDQQLFRGFLRDWLGEQPWCDVVGVAASAEEALRLVAETGPELLVVDLHLPRMGGIELVRAVRQTRPEVRSLVLTSLTDALTVTRIRESGVEGYLEKDASQEELAEALRTVAAGRAYFSRRFRETIAREGAKPMAAGKILSRREQQVLMHVLDKKTSREIGVLLGLSSRTVEFHRSNIVQKLGVTDLPELFVRARALGWEKPGGDGA